MRERESRKMELVNVRDLFRRQDEYVDQTIAIGGWVRNIRNSKNFGFIGINNLDRLKKSSVVYHDKSIVFGVTDVSHPATDRDGLS